MKATIFAQKLINITNEDTETRKFILYDENEPWMKKVKKDSGLFDITMGAYDGAEV